MVHGIWIRGILEELKLYSQDSIKFYIDNKSAIAIAENPIQHYRTKHMRISHHFFKEKIKVGVIQTIFCWIYSTNGRFFTKEKILL